MSSGTGTVRLPRWYAGLPSTRRERAAGAIAIEGSNWIGPLLIVDPAGDVEHATFGRPDDPGVALLEGYLFDRDCLTRQLGLDPQATGAGIAAAAFERWGDEVFDRLDGSYLLAVWDPERRRLLLGHDALGHHPAYFAGTADALWFGSNVLALAESARLSNRPNRVSLALAALMKWPAAGQTFFDEIRRVQPGHYLTVSSGLAVREQAYFSPWADEGEPDLAPAQVHEQLEPALIEAVGRCMDLAPTGIMLSGGLDSVTIAALATDYTSSRGLPSITAVSGRQDTDFGFEEPMQSATANALRLPHLIVRETEWTGGRNDVDLSLDVVRELPAPSRTYWVGAYMAFYRFTAARHIHTLLTGSGGDNWVAVGNGYAAECMRRFELAKLARFVRSYSGTGGLTNRQALDALVWSGGVRVLLDVAAARYAPRAKGRYHRWRSRQALPAWICPDPELREALADTLVSQRPRALTETGGVPSNYLRHEQRSMVNPYYQYEFEVGFHIESSCGLRLLSPYHDRRLVKFLNRVPPEVLLLGSKYKGLLRPVAERRLPGLGLNDQKKVYPPGLLASVLESLRAATDRAWSATSTEQLAALGVVDSARLGGRFSGTGERSFEDLITLSALMSADRWTRLHTSS